VCSGGSRFSDMGREGEGAGAGGPGHPDPEMRGSQVSIKIFSALQASVWSKSKAPPPPSPGSTTGVCGKHSHIVSITLIVWGKKLS